MRNSSYDELHSDVQRNLRLLEVLCDIALKQSLDSMNQMVEAVLEQRSQNTGSLAWAYGRLARLLPVVQRIVELELGDPDHDD